MSSPSNVLVVGGGIAGSAASIAASALVASVVMLDGGTGASTLWTGALDHTLTERQERPVSLGASALAVLHALSAYRLAAGCRLVTVAGWSRRADGHDVALLDVNGLDRVAVVECNRAAWSARELAASWGDRFAPLDVGALRFSDESFLPDADLAARHDDDERLGWLGEQIRRALSATGAPWAGVVLPSMLGVEQSQAEALSRKVGIPCGEALGLPGGPAGLRFERARDRALLRAGIAKVSTRAIRIERQDDLWRIETEGQVLHGRAVVVATGGLIGGGIAYAPSEATLATALPTNSARPFRLTVEAPFELGVAGQRLDAPGSLFGYPPESLADGFSTRSLLTTVGALVRKSDGASRPDAGPSLFAAGDVVADGPRTWLAALAEGAKAGAAAARTLLSTETSAGVIASGRPNRL